MDKDLEQYRLAKGLTYEDLAERIGASNKALARAYALGLRWPKPRRLERILRATGGEVTLEGMHRRHLDHVNSRDDDSVDAKSIRLVTA